MRSQCPDPFTVVAKALGCPRESLTVESGMYRNHGWDSFGHVTVILAIEEACEITIPNDQMMSLNTMKAIVELFQRSGNTESK
jgi:acyl carrier protein